MLTREYKNGFYTVYLNGEFLQTCDFTKNCVRFMPSTELEFKQNIIKLKGE